MLPATPRKGAKNSGNVHRLDHEGLEPLEGDYGGYYGHDGVIYIRAIKARSKVALPITPSRILHQSIIHEATQSQHDLTLRGPIESDKMLHLRSQS